jgi:hypothetical protein
MKYLKHSCHATRTILLRILFKLKNLLKISLLNRKQSIPCTTGIYYSYVIICNISSNLIFNHKSCRPTKHFKMFLIQNCLLSNKLFTSTVYKLTALDLQDVKNGRFQHAVVYRVFICQKKYLRQLKAFLLKSQLVEA